MKNIVLSLIPRILGLMDREASSETYGCFDRSYWHYKTQDYNNIRFQEASYILALLYLHNFPGNIYYNNKKILEYAKAGVDFFFKSQDRSGSFNEVYPYEHSYGATVFATAAITEVILCCNLKFDEKKLIKTARWLSKNDNKFAVNQNWVGAMAVYNISKILNNDEIREMYQSKVNENRKRQNSEGWFNEYGGFDMGYSTINLTFMAQLHKKTNDKQIEIMARRLIEYMEPKINKFGKYDFTKTSRNTQYLYPYGFYHFKSDVLNKIKAGLVKNIIINPTWMDDRFMIPFCLDYLITFIGDEK